ncbi:hypothetical protein E3N88_18174 [Mikania micrantha]|uniref:Uncharacterized protein n=1 Tax=Mikania micrantha TaxID=192012 RepID=A0A5N6NWN9_9ASTR|nr:hypothetical protein E3N88_18174 [Mikania micrantha]
MFEQENPWGNDRIVEDVKVEDGKLNESFVCLENKISSYIEKMNMGSFGEVVVPNYMFKFKMELKKQSQDVVAWFFNHIGQPNGKPYPPILPNGMEVDLLDLYWNKMNGKCQVNPKKIEESMMMIDRSHDINVASSLILHPTSMETIKMYSKTFLLVFVVVLALTSEITAAKELTFNHYSDVEDVKYDHDIHGYYKDVLRVEGFINRRLSQYSYVPIAPTGSYVLPPGVPCCGGH